mmetsp:Transcript_28225/g.93817  ORF Transcript_28225/g.93817 Transcript_28225/m.93817 type:complete len:240 (+) Transcript_28225:72-791(+)
MLHMRLLPTPVAPVGGAQLWPVATPSVGSSVAQYARYPECANAPPPLRTRRATWHSSALAKHSVVRLGLFDVLLPLLLVVVLLVPRLLGRRRHPLLDRLEGRLPLARSLRLLLREERQLHEPLVFKPLTHHLRDDDLVAQHFGASPHLPAALRPDKVVLRRVLSLVKVEPQLHVANRVISLDRDRLEDALTIEHQVGLVLVVRVVRDSLDPGDVVLGERHRGRSQPMGSAEVGPPEPGG